MQHRLLSCTRNFVGPAEIQLSASDFAYGTSLSEIICGLYWHCLINAPSHTTCTCIAYGWCIILN